MRARLRFLSGSKEGYTRPLDEPVVTVGRGRDRDIRLPARDEPKVSRAHATIRRKGDRHAVTDDGSSNGTFVNGKPVPKGATILLKDGDVITFGREGPRALFELRQEGTPSDRRGESGGARSSGRAGDRPRSRDRAGAGAAGPPRDRPSPGAPDASEGELTRLYREVVLNRPSDKGRTIALKDFVGLAMSRSRRRTRLMILGTLATSVLAVATVGAWGAWERRRAQTQIAQLEAESNTAIASLETQVSRITATRDAAEDEIERLESALAELRRQQAEELERISRQVGFTEDVAARFASGVAMVTNRLVFRETGGSALVRIEPGRDGEPELVLGGSGPELSFPSAGTGFLIHRDGWLFTNRHVVDGPWVYHTYGQEIADEVADVIGVAVEPEYVDFHAYFPDSETGLDVTLAGVSETADVALLRLIEPATGARPLPLAPPTTGARVGQEVVLMGYPTAHRLLLGRLGADRAQRIYEQACSSQQCASVEDRDRLVTLLAQADEIQPMVSSGAVNTLTERQISYGVEGSSTGGSSGGPLIGSDHLVIGVNWGRFNPSPDDPGFRVHGAAPIRYGWELLPEEVRAQLVAAAAVPRDRGSLRSAVARCCR